MSYNCYLFGEKMPTPAKLTVKISGKNSTVTLLDEGEISFLKYPGLTEITLPLTFPMLSAKKQPDYYLSLLERAKTDRSTTQFIMTRTTPAGKLLFDTNIKVSVEDYTISESAVNGLDVSVDIKLKQYRDYGTKIITVDPPESTQSTPATESTTKVASVIKERSTATLPRISSYVTKLGDTLWGIAKRLYGDGSKYTELLNANKDRISDPNYIQLGEELYIP